MTQHKAAVRNRYLSNLTAIHWLGTSHQVAFDEAQTIGRDKRKAGRLFVRAIHSNENPINKYITLQEYYTLIKDRPTV